jgi:hypothetical protein
MTMTTTEPASAKNLDGYDAPLIPWEKVRACIEQTFREQGPGPEGRWHTHWVATTCPNGRPHNVPVGAVWMDEAFYFTAGDSTRKARNLALNPHCVITFSGAELDVVGPIRARTADRHEYVTGASHAHRIEDPLEQIGPVERNEEDRGSTRRWRRPGSPPLTR